MPVTQKTPSELQLLLRSLSNISNCKPQQQALTMKIARAIIGTRKALEAFETIRQELLATLPPEPKADADPEVRQAFDAAKTAIDVRYRKVFDEQKFDVNLPKPITLQEAQHFKEMPSPNDLATLAPDMLELGEED